MRNPAALAAMLLATACAGGADTGDDGHTDTGDDDHTDTGDTADTAGTDSADTGTTDTDAAPVRTGRLRFVGTATALDAYDGVEIVSFTDAMTGEPLCTVALALASTAPRVDCLECDWAFTVTVTSATPERDVACAAVGWADPAAAVGSTRGYGFVALYFGHAPVLMVETDGVWNALGYAEYAPTSGAFAYERDDGFHVY